MQSFANNASNNSSASASDKAGGNGSAVIPMSPADVRCGNEMPDPYFYVVLSSL